MKQNKHQRHINIPKAEDGTTPLIRHPDYEPANLSIAKWELQETPTGGAKIRIAFGVGPADEKPDGKA